MLGKLIKYELKSTARTLIPLYIALLMFALINKLFMGINNNANSELLGGIPVMITIFAYGCTMVAIFIITFFVIVQRFYKNLLGDEGYLMNTLPVPTWMNILSKLGASIIWIIVSGIVSVLSIIIMAFSKGMFTDLFANFAEFTGYVPQEYYRFALEIILYAFVSMISSILILYLSISIGHLFNKRRILASFGAFIVLSMIINTIKGIIQAITFIANESSFMSAIHVLLVCEILFGIVFFIACNYIIKNKLNLE